MSFTFPYACGARFKNSWKIEGSFREAIRILGDFGTPGGASGFHGPDVPWGQRKEKVGIAERPAYFVAQGRVSK